MADRTPSTAASSASSAPGPDAELAAHPALAAAVASLAAAPWDTSAWSTIIAQLQALPLDASTTATIVDANLAICRRLYEAALKLFPLAAHVWLAYCNAETAANNAAGVEALLNRCLPQCLDPALWLFYVNFVIKTKVAPAAAALASASAPGAAAPENAPAAREALAVGRRLALAATEAALSSVGAAFHAAPLWNAYIDLIKSLPEDTAYEASTKRDMLRKAYQRAIAVPHQAVEPLWAEYCEWERGHSQPALAANFIKTYDVAFATAREVQKERAALWAGLDTAAALAAPANAPRAKPSSGDQDATARLADSWRRIIAYELSNPLQLPKEVHAAVVRLHFKQALAALRFHPELWHDLATFERDVKPAAAAAQATGAASTEDPAGTVYNQALALMPTSALLALASADHHEMGGRAEQARAAFAGLVAALSDVAATGNATADGFPDWEQRLAPLPQGGVATTTMFVSPADAADANSTLPSVYILWQRAARRLEGVEGARAVFAQARKASHATADVYLASAYLEYFANRQLPVARNILEAGRKRFPTDASYALSCVDLLSYIDDSTNVRAFFENVLAALPPVESRPVWDRFIAYELDRAQGGGTLAAVQALEQRRAAAHPQLASAEARLLARQLHRYAVFGKVAGTAVDAGFLSRQPYTPLATLHRPAAAAAAAAAAGDAGDAVARLTLALSGQRQSADPARHISDGLYLQAPILRATPVSHLPAGTVLAEAAAGGALTQRLALPAAPPALLRLLQALPAFDPLVPERIARSSLISGGGSASGGGIGNLVSWRDADAVMAVVSQIAIPGVNVGAKRKFGMTERDG